MLYVESQQHKDHDNKRADRQILREDEYAYKNSKDDCKHHRHQKMNDPLMLHKSYLVHMFSEDFGQFGFRTAFLEPFFGKLHIFG